MLKHCDMYAVTCERSAFFSLYICIYMHICASIYALLYGSLPLLVQSSCTTPYSEAEGAYMQNMQGPSQKNWSATNLSNSVMGKHGECAMLDKESVMPDSENRGRSYYLVFPLFLLLCKMISPLSLVMQKI